MDLRVAPTVCGTDQWGFDMLEAEGQGRPKIFVPVSVACGLSGVAMMRPIGHGRVERVPGGRGGSFGSCSCWQFVQTSLTMPQ